MGARPRQSAALADRQAREFLRKADPVLAGVIDAHPGFRPRAWMDELPPLDAFATLIFQVAGQQLSVAATRTIVSRIEQRFGGRLPSPAELLAADPQVLRAAGLSARKGATLRALAERFVDGRLSDAALERMTDEEVEAALTAVKGARFPARRAEPARRLSHRRYRVASRDPTDLRFRPRSLRGRAGQDIGPLAAVSQPSRELRVRLRVRGAALTRPRHHRRRSGTARPTARIAVRALLLSSPLF